MRDLMYGIALALVLIVILGGTTFAEEHQVNIEGMSVEDLLSLREEINLLLESKGYKVYFDVERGTKGESVSVIQEKLAELGFYTGKITGKYDSETQKAFKMFEKTYGLMNDGLASREDQIVLFGAEPVLVEEKEPAVVEQESELQGMNMPEHDVLFDYEQCMRYPEAHIGEQYVLKGRVEQTLGSRTEGFQLRFSILGNTDEIIYVFVRSDPGYNILENDWLIIDVTMSGTVTYESTWGKMITIPAANAGEIVLR